MKRGGFLKRKTGLKKKSTSDTATTKDNIQALLREIVMLRDGGCILRDVRCGNSLMYAAAGVVFQADHLIERSNSATYADPRLVVCVCKNCHGWKHFKKSNHDQYNAIIKDIIEPERVALWEACEKDSWKPHRTSAHDWLKEEAYLKTKLAAMQRGSTND